MKMKITLRYHLTFLRMVSITIQTKRQQLCVDEEKGKRLLLGMQTWVATKN